MSLHFEPVIIGIGEVVNRNVHAEAAVEPADLMIEAINRCIDDALTHEIIEANQLASQPPFKSQIHPITSSRLHAHISSITVVPPWTWQYASLPKLLATKLGLANSINLMHLEILEHGGNGPILALDEAAKRIARGEHAAVIITGGEALASLASCSKLGVYPPPSWTPLPLGTKPVVLSEIGQGKSSDIGRNHGIGLPIHVYPLYEMGRRAFKQQTPHENIKENEELYSRFESIARKNTFSWGINDHTWKTGSKREANEWGRFVCLPYPLLMNAFNTVNLAAAVILTSTDLASKLGISKEKWIYPIGGAGTSDNEEFWLRPNFFSSPAISRTLDTTLAVSGNLKIDDIELLDMYSCFPIVPKLAADHLGLKITGKGARELTVLGGLTFFGGAGNNYSMHAITEMVRRLRQNEHANSSLGRVQRRRYGLILANGGVVTYQHAMCLSNDSRNDNFGYPVHRMLPSKLSYDDCPDMIDLVKRRQRAIIETYTVQFDRSGRAEQGYIIGRLGETGVRFLANPADADSLELLSDQSKEWIGIWGWVYGDEAKRQNFFKLETNNLPHL